MQNNSIETNVLDQTVIIAEKKILQERIINEEARKNTYTEIKDSFESEANHESSTTEYVEELNEETNKELNEQLNEKLSKSKYLVTQKKKKPVWRGKVHRLAFYKALIMFLFSLFFLRTNRAFLSVYFISQMALYGVSSTYHMTKWRTRRAEKLIQRLDHTCIFFLISGTQICILKATAEIAKIEKYVVVKYIYITYIIAAFGVIKVFFFPKTPRYFNVLYYIIHGGSISLYIPFSAMLQEKIILCFWILGGLSYVIGGVIYGLKKPNPSPKIFGYHEIFHVLTVVANMCFFLTLVWANCKAKTL